MQSPPPEPSLARSPLSSSRALHERVRRFATLSLADPDACPEGADAFDRLALDIARYQAAECPGYARLVAARGGNLDDVQRLPAVPTDAFRFARVATHPEELDAYLFRTSGTTAAESGRHAIRDIDTYRVLALAWAKQTLFQRLKQAVVVALAPLGGPKETSSLAFMMGLFMQEFDGRALSASPEGAPFSAQSPQRWLISDGAPDALGLKRAARIARARHEPLVLLATSFALAALIEAGEDDELDLPEGSLVMITGGFKGRMTNLDESTLRKAALHTFRIPESSILAEYGMTELTSQLYERWGRPGRYHAPPWLRVSAVDPVSHEPRAEGAVGVARFVDLGNVDSAVCVVTEDLVRVTESGLELVGRRPGAEPRGCSLPFEGLLAASKGASK